MKVEIRRVSLALVVAGACMVGAAAASAHIERTSYWPAPAADASVRPPAGGAVPVARSLSSSLRRTITGRTRVACKRDSLRRALWSIRRARRSGYRLRPTQPLVRLSRARARRARRLSRALFERCRFRHVQAAVVASRNNDRVVVMPGEYREEPSRRRPTNDPRCAHLRETNALGRVGAASFRYQVACPNDQSLVYVQGREPGDVLAPSPPPRERFGIPDEGPCLRCNLQIEGSGVTPLDVVIDAARETARSVRARATPSKDVVIRADRADGIVIRNLTTAHAREHGIYVHETDGYLLDDFKALYNDLYGALVFTSDHGLISDCELSGHRDSGVYPGGAPDTAAQRVEAHPRLNQAITRCDLHHNAIGYSANMGNAVHVYDNAIYDNTTGVLNLSLFPAGHPGYPQDSAVFEGNDIYSNNLNAYAAGSDVTPAVPLPIGVGILTLGGNDNTFRRNRIWDNWRRGAMQASLPDVIGDPNGGRLFGSTSHRNRYHDNVMGLAPDGTGAPNGVDFWWDEAPGQRDNCWHSNGTVTSNPVNLPARCRNVSAGLSYAVHLAELLPCLAAFQSATRDPDACAWFRMPPAPAGRRHAGDDRARLRARRAAARPRLRGGGLRRARWSDPFATTERLQVATCADWRTASAGQRLGAARSIRAIIAGSGGDGRTLAEHEGHDALDVSCRGAVARDFLLYELYARAVAFAARGAP